MNTITKIGEDGQMLKNAFQNLATACEKAAIPFKALAGTLNDNGYKDKKRIPRKLKKQITSRK